MDKFLPDVYDQYIKGLMRRRKKTGEEAYQWLRRRSMDSRKPIRQLAEAILLSEDLE